MRAPEFVPQETVSTIEVAGYPVSPPPFPDRPGQIHRWEDLSFLHWPYAPEQIERLLPPGLTVDTFQGSAWVGLIPFRLRITIPGVPFVPWVGAFEETNVRTYVRGPDGTPGIWFLSLDAARLGAVLGARATWSLPYVWSEMQITRVHDTIAYESRRRWPRARGAATRVVLRIGDAYEPDEVAELDRFLTARWWLFAQRRGRLSLTTVTHAPWPLRHASVVDLDDHLLVAAGLPAPQGAPLVHHAGAVDVRMSRRVPVAGEQS